MARNGKQSPPRPRIEIRHGTASPEEAAAIAAAIEQFVRDTAPSAATEKAAIGPWLEAALLEGVGRHPEGGAPWGKLAPSGPA